MKPELFLLFEDGKLPREILRLFPEYDDSTVYYYWVAYAKAKKKFIELRRKYHNVIA